MKAIELYEHILTEQNKVDAPALLLNDYNYLINKGIYQFVNKQYNFFDVNLQVSDSLINLRVTKTITDNKIPKDYMHILSCSVNYPPTGICENSVLTYGARRMTSDFKGQIFNNYYMKPTKKRPYFLVVNDDLIIYNNNTPFESVTIDYLKTPEEIKLTEVEIEDEDGMVIDYEITGDLTLEFPEYACYEIINDVVKLILENSSDPRLQTQMAINQSIAPPIPTLTSKK